MTLPPRPELVPKLQEVIKRSNPDILWKEECTEVPPLTIAYLIGWLKREFNLQKSFVLGERPIILREFLDDAYRAV